MSNPVIFTSEEQVELSKLNQSLRILNNTIILLQEGSFKGGQAQAVLEGIAFVQDLLRQCTTSVKTIEFTAQNRKPEEEKKENK